MSLMVSKILKKLSLCRIQLLEDLKDLYDTHDHLATWLSAKERMTAALGPISSDPRMVQSQVEQALQSTRRKSSTWAFHVCETRCKTFPTRSIRRPLKKIRNSICDDCKLASANWKARDSSWPTPKLLANSCARDGREFDATVAKTLGWLSEELGSLSDRLLISADRDILQQQVEAHEPIYKDVLAKEHQIIMLLDKGASQQQKSTEKHLSSRSLDNLRNQWDRLKREAVERQTRLATSMEHCRKYYKALESFVPWLSQAENRLDALRPDSFARRDLDKHLQELAAFRNDLWKKSGEFEHLRSLGETFVASCDIDKDIVVQELSAAKARWDKLNNELLGRISSLEELGRRIADASDRLGAVTSSVQRCEYHLNSHDTLPTHTDAATLSRLSTLRDEVLALRKPLDSLRSTCADLDDEIARVGRGKTSGLSDEVKALSERLDDLTNRLDDRCDRAQVAAKAVQQYNVCDFNSSEL
ncbi:unnamed protein product [Nesidiocoris tenuis]|uniref:KASH domain-containing protein n=1 Tax=Nesidiocoris tenuis TaxID=355587 RepID=A0A6H5HDJ7_9HEMI|nr:unnamed protein product [Nesidiocoris tenuis]